MIILGNLQQGQQVWQPFHGPDHCPSNLCETSPAGEKDRILEFVFGICGNP